MTKNPLWSVMIPTYNACNDYLIKTLESVLEQDPGVEWMQIEVIDDCSPNGPPVDLVKSVAGSRIKVISSKTNNGLARTWNECIKRSKGEWIHILHQDDYVINGFYRTLAKGIVNRESVGAAFVRHYIYDNITLAASDILLESPGILDEFLPRIGVKQLIQTPSVVVKKSVYERLGGFRQDIKYALDWEMWLRIARNYDFWYDPEILAVYRVHQGSETSRLKKNLADYHDVINMINITNSYQDKNNQKKVLSIALRNSSFGLLDRLDKNIQEKEYLIAIKIIGAAIKNAPSFQVVFRCLKNLLKAIASNGSRK